MSSQSGFLFHIMTRDEWFEATAVGHYAPASLTEEGFIHCSTRDQVVGSAEAYYHGRANLILLQIDSAHVAAPIVDEDLTGRGLSFPHIYGVLNLDAVTAVFDFPPNPDGGFDLPAALQTTG